MSSDEAEVWVRIYAATISNSRTNVSNVDVAAKLAERAVEDFHEWQEKQSNKSYREPGK
jgi:hypothetical protein